MRMDIKKLKKILNKLPAYTGAFGKVAVEEVRWIESVERLKERRLAEKHERNAHAFFSLLKSPHPSVRARAAVMLGKLGKKLYGDELLSLALNEKEHVYVRACGLWSAALVGEGWALDEVASFLSHSDPQLRWAAVEALAHTGTKRAFYLLMPAVNDKEFFIKCRAYAELLAGREPAAFALIDHLKTEYKEVATRLLLEMGDMALSSVLYSFALSNEKGERELLKEVLLLFNPDRLISFLEKLLLVEPQVAEAHSELFTIFATLCLTYKGTLEPLHEVLLRSRNYAMRMQCIRVLTYFSASFGRGARFGYKSCRL